MKHRPHYRLALLASAVLTIPTIAWAAAPEEQATVGGWAQGVWEAASRGDLQALEQALDEVPGDAPQGQAARFRTSRAQLRTHRTAALADRVDARATAMAEMREEVEGGNLTKALRKAVEAQALSDDFDEAFGEPEIMELITWAEDRIPAVEKERSWLEAQELLYMLRAFYEDTERRAEYDTYAEHLERVNQRVGLLARYAPRRLHEMRNARAERLGEEGYGEFNPATMVDWREPLDDVDIRMLRGAFRKAAGDHIESEGWRPLLEGGLDAMNVLATTTALGDTFPQLRDAASVSEWVRMVDERREWLSLLDDQKLSSSTCRDVIDELVELNARTLELPNELIVREFGDGGMDRLDTYSEIIWPDKIRRFQQATAGNFVGVGILIRHNDKREILVVNPLEGTPAYFNGVKPNDLITEVDGDSTVGWSLNDAVDRITGPRGSIVRLGLQREGEEDVIEVPIERDVIKIRSVKGWSKTGVEEDGEPIWDWYIDGASGIAYMRLTQFTEDTAGDIRSAWAEITEAGAPRGLILDLRHNPGGLLTAAVNISNFFVKDRVTIVTGEDKYRNRAWVQRAQPNRAIFADVPTVVLINKGSASASEIVAGCLQTHHAAVVVGERSYGKGSVQTVHEVMRQEPGCLLKLTTQYYRLPSPDGGATPGRLVHKRTGAVEWGVDPDVEVKMSVQQVIDAINLRQEAEIIAMDPGALEEGEEAPDINDLLTEGIDPQLQTALLLLQARVMGTGDVKHAARRRAAG
jgi:carboxyl-terminal processing protease